MFNTFAFNTTMFNGASTSLVIRPNDEIAPATQSVLSNRDAVSILGGSIQGSIIELSSKDTQSILTERDK